MCIGLYVYYNSCYLIFCLYLALKFIIKMSDMSVYNLTLLLLILPDLKLRHNNFAVQPL